ncbi:MAG: M3 family metallopeptidase, partial [Pseudomonadota bacterium]
MLQSDHDPATTALGSADARGMMHIELAGFSLPDFDRLKLADITAATEALLKEMEQRFEALAEAPHPEFESLVTAVEDLRHELSQRWSPFSHLNMVQYDEKVQEEFVAALSRVTAFSTKLAQDARIYAAYERIHAGLPDTAPAATRQLLSQSLRDFRLAGVALNSEDKSRFIELMQALSEAQSTFASNLQQCTDAWHWHTEDAAEVAGIPASNLAQAEAAARSAGLDGWRFGLDQPTYQAVVRHARQRGTRERFYTAWMTRASDQGPHAAAFDNSELVTKILGLRQEMVALLGFSNFAEYSLAPKMAGSVTAVTDFLRDLALRSRPTAEREMADLAELAGHALAPWDTAYYAEQNRERQFAITDRELRPYLPAERVMQGLFSLASRLYGLTLEAVDVPTWHTDVGFLAVKDAAGETLGG